MMKFIQFDKEKCDSCYKCLRVCPTKAISFNKSDRKIVDALCIKCGLCEASCPQDALTIRSQLEEVFSWIKEQKQVSVSIAPSFVGAFGLDEPTVMATALRKLGFNHIEETAIGAEIIAEHYDQVIEDYVQAHNVDAVVDHKTHSFITSCCPSANYLVEEYYPSLIPYIIPVVSPMIAHGRQMKAYYGEKEKIVFIGPCLAKMAEAEEMAGAIDAVITFEELELMFQECRIDLVSQHVSFFDRDGSIRGCGFPLGGSLRNKEGSFRDDIVLRYIHVDGIENCMHILNELKTGALSNCVIELNSCAGSCVNGPDMPKNKLKRYERELFMRQYMKRKQCELKRIDALQEETHIDVKQTLSISIHRTFSDKQLKQIEPRRDEVINIMNKMGKYSIQDELNCGACGYTTCNEKAKAVFYGYSDHETCLPFLRKKAESMQSLMIENSPNVVALIDNNLTIIEVNPSFLKLFSTSYPQKLDVIGLPIELFINHLIFSKVIATKQSVYNQKIYLQESQRYFIVNIIYLEENQRMIVFMTDISQEMQRQEEFSRVKEETLLKTQEVIDKQMRVAQEIASLLGETTAETKMSLLGLKKLVMNDRGVYE